MAEQEKTIQEQNRENLGALGIGAGIVTGIVAKTPIGRQAKKIYSGIKGLIKPKNEISDLPATKGNELSNARFIQEDETLTALQKRQKEAREQMDYDVNVVDDIKQRVASNPLTLGGRNTAADTDVSVHGSALFDAIATFPNMGRKKGYQAPAEAWADYFKKGQVGKIGDVKINVTRDELADTNIAYFDEKNNLIGGYLKLAQDEKVPVSAKTLLEMVSQSPAHNTAHIRMGYGQDLKPVAEDFFEEFDDVIARVKKQVDDLANKNDIARQKDPNVPINADAVRLQEDLDDLVEYYYTKGTDFKARNFGASLKPSKQSDDEFINSLGGAVRGLRDKSERFDDLGIPFDTTFNDFINKFDNFAAVLQREIGTGTSVKHSQDDAYRLFGPETYHEDLIYFKNMDGGSEGQGIFGLDFKMPRARHYSGVADNQLYHIRYGRRALEGSPNEKVYVLDELQADVQQATQRELRRGNPQEKESYMRFNPTNSGYLKSLFRDRRVEKYYEMEDLITNQTNLAGRFDESTAKEYARLSKEFDEISAAQADPKSGSASAEELKQKYNNSNIDFQPMLDTEKGWGSHGMKYLIKQAIRNDVDYIAINPAEMVSFKKRGSDRKIGTLQYYGNARGKAGYENYTIGDKKTNPKQTATLPKILEDLAKQYKSEAKTIRVAKSDPKKRFKVIQEGRFDAGEETFTYANTEHLAAFKTKLEAERFNELRNGKIVEMDADDPDLYYPVFGLKITPEMKSKPFKLYKKTGGLVVDIFKW
jgi:hypothetical protein|tara:strand:+ start:483 stop:2768 length:2286 start_codon:yes stop_codon:yes gene_type:complete